VRIGPGSALLLLCAPVFAADRGRLLAVRAMPGGDASIVEVVGDRPLSFTTLRLESPPRVVVDVVDADPEGIAPEQVVDDGSVRRIAVARAGENTARVVIELCAESEFDVHGDGSRLEVRIARAAPAVSLEEVTRARAELPTVSLVAAQPPPADTPRVPAEPRGETITGIGFRPQEGAVIVRSDGPLDASVTSDDRVVLVHFPGARIPLVNNRRPLDTSFFVGPVARVVPRQLEAGADLRIELRSRAEVHLQQTGGLLTVSFTPAAN
jgi:AMIN domain